MDYWFLWHVFGVIQHWDPQKIYRKDVPVQRFELPLPIQRLYCVTRIVSYLRPHMGHHIRDCLVCLPFNPRFLNNTQSQVLICGNGLSSQRSFVWEVLVWVVSPFGHVPKHTSSGSLAIFFIYSWFSMANIDEFYWSVLVVDHPGGGRGWSVTCVCPILSAVPAHFQNIETIFF